MSQSGPVVFDSFEEWARQAGLSEAEIAEHDQWGATIGERFDSADMRRQWAERAAVRAADAVRAAERAGELVEQEDGYRPVTSLVEYLEQSVAAAKRKDQPFGRERPDGERRAE